MCAYLRRTCRLLIPIVIIVMLHEWSYAALETQHGSGTGNETQGSSDPSDETSDDNSPVPLAPYVYAVTGLLLETYYTVGIYVSCIIFALFIICLICCYIHRRRRRNTFWKKQKHISKLLGYKNTYTEQGDGTVSACDEFDYSAY